MSYQTENYAAALAEFGTPRHLSHCRGWVLERDADPDRNGGLRDATGCYPLFSCADWSQLGPDVMDLQGSGLVSLTLVTDPFADVSSDQLRVWFPQVARPYKPHYLVDLTQTDAPFGSAHHRRNARRFGRQGRVEVCPDPATEWERWTALYDHLIARHDITGPARFSAESFQRQLALPGVTLLRAVTDSGELAGMQIWFSDAEHAWYHLGAYSELGYRLGGASAALTASALQHFQARAVRWANLGSGAGLRHDAEDGLSRFKRGWSSETRWAWLCGVILDERAYARAEQARFGSGPVPEFFPSYRAPVTAPHAAKQEAVYAHAD